MSDEGSGSESKVSTEEPKAGGSSTRPLFCFDDDSDLGFGPKQLSYLYSGQIPNGT